MKRIVSVALIALMLVSAMLTLTACGSAYEGIKKNFVDAGFEEVQKDNENATGMLAITAAVEEGEVSCTVHMLVKVEGFLGAETSSAIVLEFSGDADAQKAMAEYMENDVIRATIEELDSTKLVKGNCVLLPISLKASNIETMVELFNQ